jgi:hypothetical protein
MRAILARGVEIDLRRFLRPGRRFERNLRLCSVENLGADRVGESADSGVIGLYRLIIIAASNEDRIFRAFDL